MPFLFSHVHILAVFSCICISMFLFVLFFWRVVLLVFFFFGSCTFLLGGLVVSFLPPFQVCCSNVDTLQVIEDHKSGAYHGKRCHQTLPDSM